MSVLNGGGSPLRHEEDRGGSIVLDLCLKLGGNDVWTLVSVASYWMKVVFWPPRLPKYSTWIFPHRCFYSIERGRCSFRLAIPLSSQLLSGSYGTPHNEFLGKSQVLPTVEAVRDLCPQILQN